MPNHSGPGALHPGGFGAAPNDAMRRHNEGVKEGTIKGPRLTPTDGFVYSAVASGATYANGVGDDPG